MIKCDGCSSKENHKFSDCLSVECGCTCVQELHSTGVNELIDDVSDSAPDFLKIGEKEMRSLPDVTKDILNFSKVRKSEWLPVKKDRRFKARKR
jgi:hypothetical protein